MQNWKWTILSAVQIKSKLLYLFGDQNLKGRLSMKCANGRAGRHFVYAFKYVMYYIHLLESLKDQDTLRLIAPKIRKASASIVNHRKVWEYLCTTYLRVSTFFVANIDKSYFVNIGPFFPISIPILKKNSMPSPRESSCITCLPNTFLSK